MNALYLTYTILAIVYFLGKQRWEKDWLQQGNYLFLAIVSTFMLCINFMEFSIAYYHGYLFEMLAYHTETIGKPYRVILLTLILLPSIGILNYFRGFRQNQNLQAMLWIAVVSSLLTTAYQNKRINVIMPLDTGQGSISPGWHTSIPEPLSLTDYLLVMVLGIAITAILGWWLGRRFD